MVCNLIVLRPSKESKYFPIRLCSKLTLLERDLAESLIKGADYFFTLASYDSDTARAAGSQLACSLLLEAGWPGGDPSQPVNLLFDDDHLHLWQFFPAHDPEAIWPSAFYPKDMPLMAFAVLLRQFGLNPMSCNRMYEEICKKKASIAHNYRAAFVVGKVDENSDGRGEQAPRPDLSRSPPIAINIPRQLAMKESTDGPMLCLRVLAFAVLGIPMHNSLYWLEGVDTQETRTDRAFTYFIQY